jgi:hypothetical protein
MADSPPEGSPAALRVEVITEVTAELIAQFALLIPQLSASAPPPGGRELGDMIASPGTTLFVARLETASSPLVGSLTLVVYRIPTGLHAVIEDVVVD